MNYIEKDDEFGKENIKKICMTEIDFFFKKKIMIQTKSKDTMTVNFFSRGKKCFFSYSLRNLIKVLNENEHLKSFILFLYH